MTNLHRNFAMFSPPRSMARHLLAAAALVMLSACAGIVTPPASFTIYDLELPAATVRPLERTSLAPASIEVRAPSWLSSSAMQYRLDFRQPSSREVFAESRWAGHPAEMLQRHLIVSLGTSGRTHAQCRLRIDLDEFIQRFDALDASASELVVRASLLAARDETVLVRNRFVIVTPAASADAAGGVLAHRQGARQLTDSIQAWLDALDDDTAGGLNVAERCRP